MAKDNTPIKNSEMKLPWERQEKESAEAFEAFAMYRDMGKSRSVRGVAQKLDKSDTLIGRWSSKHNWVDRVAAYEMEIDRQATEQHMKDIAKMRARHAQVGKLGMTISELKLKSFLKVKNNEDGTQTLILDPEKADELTMRNLSSLIETASKLERISMGDVGEVVEERDGGAATPAVQIYIPDNNRDKDNVGDE